MELAFEKNAVDHLQKLVCQVVSQEETAETVVPDSLPDVGRIVGCWGVPVVRSKEWRQNGMGVSGGVSAWVLYVPEEGGAPRQVAVYLPLHRKVGIPADGARGAGAGFLPRQEHRCAHGKFSQASGPRLSDLQGGGVRSRPGGVPHPAVSAQGTGGSAAAPAPAAAHGADREELPAG